MENIETEEVEDDNADMTVSRRNENAVTRPLNAVEEMEESTTAGPSNTVDGKMLNRSLYETCKVDFPELEGDAKFLDEFEVFFLRYKEDTTPAFSPTILKFQRVYDFARKNLKR